MATTKTTKTATKTTLAAEENAKVKAKSAKTVAATKKAAKPAPKAAPKTAAKATAKPVAKPVKAAATKAPAKPKVAAKAPAKASTKAPAKTPAKAKPLTAKKVAEPKAKPLTAKKVAEPKAKRDVGVAEPAPLATSAVSAVVLTPEQEARLAMISNCAAAQDDGAKIQRRLIGSNGKWKNVKHAYFNSDKHEYRPHPQYRPSLQRQRRETEEAELRARLNKAKGNA